MAGIDGNRWETARRELIVRWRAIVERIDAHDEGGVLTLANVMDEFCDEAAAERQSALSRSDRPIESPPLTPAGGTRPVGDRCLFCRGFMEMGGCFGVLDEVSHAVFARRWDEAHRLAESYISHLESMPLGAPSGSDIFLKA